jgi:hypothetical protein
MVTTYLYLVADDEVCSQKMSKQAVNRLSDSALSCDGLSMFVASTRRRAPTCRHHSPSHAISTTLLGCLLSLASVLADQTLMSGFPSDVVSYSGVSTDHDAISLAGRGEAID